MLHLMLTRICPAPFALQPNEWCHNCAVQSALYYYTKEVSKHLGKVVYIAKSDLWSITL